MNRASRFFSSIPTRWQPSYHQSRFAEAKRLAGTMLKTYDTDARTVEAVLSVGAPVQRFYGKEILRITRDAVDLKRITTCGVPLINSHNVFSIAGIFGQLQRGWIENGKLLGTISFDDSEDGRRAEGMVLRGVLRGVSIGYRVDEWEVEDEEGNVIDPERDRFSWEETAYTFTAIRWELMEVSLVSVPADLEATVRSFAQSGAASRADLSAEETVEHMRVLHRMTINHIRTMRQCRR